MQSEEWPDRLSAYLEEVSSFLEQTTTAEERLALSLGLLLLAVLIGSFLLPRIVRSVDQSVTNRFVSGRIADTVELLSKYAPTTAGGIVLRTVQLTLLVAVAVFVLILWGQSGLVVWTVSWLADKIPLVAKIITSGILVVLGYIGAAILSDAVEDFSDQTEWMTDHQEEIVLRVSQLGFFMFMGLVVMAVWDVNLGNLLVGAGFLGIVIGFAARQTLGSLIAGFVLMFSRPFTIGDWVQIGDEEGIVTDITIFNTRLENFDGEFVIIPNDRVSNQAVTNRSQKGLLRLRIDVGIDYDTDPDHARAVALEAISDLQDVVDSPPPQVFPKAFGDSAVVLEMRFWIDHPTPPRKWKAVSAVIPAIKTAFAAEDIKIPFPQQELSGRAETGGFRVHDASPESTVGPVEPQEQD